MCRSDHTNSQTKMRLRTAGLRGLRAYIVILDYADELDSFVSKQSQARIIPTILDNMQYDSPYVFFLSFVFAMSHSECSSVVESENGSSVSNLATEVLKDLSSRVNNITVTAVVTAVLKYLFHFY